jgi:putative transposase
MYEYRRATPEVRKELLEERQHKSWPWHAPPHFADGEHVYLLTAACFEHQSLMASEARRDEWLAAVQSCISDSGGELRGWVVLPNHYHLVARVDLTGFAAKIARLHNGKATQWNREDQTQGRKVWHRFADRRIRNDGHYFASLNYVHANPVHHGLAERSDVWRWSSLAHYRDAVGLETLDEWTREYPADRFGAGWDV